MTLSEDDVKAIFFILDNNGKQCISRDDLRQFNDD